ncbi:MAG: 30S ribosomal protein S16 [Planctomycetes bacterium]|nr:30S ribosomal protein S16 [Planctomycetota bacterium]
MVKLRLKRFGRRGRPYFRLNAMDIRSPRDGTSIENLGTYDPLEKDQSKAVVLNADRVRYWLSVGAQPTETVATLISKAGIELPAGVVKEKARLRTARTLTQTRQAATEVKKAAKAADAAKAAEAKKAAAAEPAKAE